MVWSKPETDEIRAALRPVSPAPADATIEFLAEGWGSWAFRAGDYVLRFPKIEAMVDEYRKELSLMPVLAPTLPVPVSVPDLFLEHGPNGTPFIGHKALPGVLLFESGIKPGPGFGRKLGGFLRSLHSFPASRVIDLGVPLHDGPRVRELRGAQYEDVLRRVASLVSCEARTHIEHEFETYLNDPRNFDFEPVLVHSDLDSNILVDADTGELTGVIDFGDAVVGSLALDLWMPVYGFQRLGIASQTEECLGAAGVDEEQVDAMMPELRFLEFRWPLLDILYGLDSGQPDFVEGGIRALNASLPSGLKCD
jgi:aminoglycoside phosphotransferase (APT) family kinase protein